MNSHNQNIIELTKLELAIRSGYYPDSPKLLYYYLNFGKDCADSWEELYRHKVYERLFNTLIDAISDSLVPMQWRQLCLDNINRPLIELEKLAKTKMAQKLLRRRYTELKLLANYYLVEGTSK
ncbi:MAG: hypothetical protein ACI854_000812 [Arenicella sp.]|jgi:hypothetical protein